MGAQIDCLSDGLAGLKVDIEAEHVYCVTVYAIVTPHDVNAKSSLGISIISALCRNGKLGRSLKAYGKTGLYSTALPGT